MKKSVFGFKGHSFEGVRLFEKNEDFKTITQQCGYKVEIEEWNHEEFYKHATKHDVFVMDDKYLCVPCHNGLWIYGDESTRAWKEYLDARKQLQEIKAKREQAMRILEENGFFLITSVHRDDLKAIGFDAEKITDEEMHNLANILKNDYISYFFLDSLSDNDENLGFPKLSE